MTPALTILAVLAALSGPELQLRRGLASPTAEITALDAGGVTVGTKPATIYSWDLVRSVTGEKAAAAAAYRDVADKTWRARVRLERGDVASAEPLLEELLPVVGSSKGPTASIVAEGLLVCRVARGARTMAVAPWLVWLASAPGSDAVVPAARIGPIPGLAGTVIDAETGLATDLPPLWINVPAVVALVDGVGVSPAGPKATTLAALYQASARHELGRDVKLEPLDAALATDPGVKLVWEMVQAAAADDKGRAAARTALSARLRGELPSWTEAWVRAALGRSLVREQTAEHQMEGVIHLLNIPARKADASPYITGLALAESAVALHKLGDAKGADRLYREFVDRFPSHPAQQWEPIRSWRPATPKAEQPKPTEPPAKPAGKN